MSIFTLLPFLWGFHPNINYVCLHHKVFPKFSHPFISQFHLGLWFNLSFFPIGIKAGVLFQTSVCENPVFPAAFTEETVLSSRSVCSSFVKDKLVENAWIYFGDLVHMSTFLSILCCFGYGRPVNYMLICVSIARQFNYLRSYKLHLFLWFCYNSVQKT